ncbi:PQQ-binding-like beta-propeller repeat protein [Thermodesulfobacteriota bacterium]
MFKKFKKIFLTILGVVLIGVIVWVVMNRVHYDVVYRSDYVQPSATMEHDIVLSKIEPMTKGDADWICWRGINGDGRSSVSGIKTDWSDGLEKKWEINYLCQGKESATWSAPVVQGNRLVVCGRDDVNDIVFCLNPEDGGLIWKQAYTAKTARTNYGAGPRATPWIDDDRVYTFGRGGDLVCWNLLNGKKIWHKNVNNEGGEERGAGHSSSPLVTDSLVIVNGGGTARTIAFDKVNGDLVWKTGSGHAGYAAISRMEIEGEPVVLSFHASGLAAITLRDGKLLWDVEWKANYHEKATTPVIKDNLVFINCGSIKNRGGEVLKVSKSGAEVVWESKVFGSLHSDPFIIDGHIYGYSGDSDQNRGYFKCVELETGVEKWSSKEVGWGTCVGVEDYLFCCDVKGSLFLIKPDPEKFVKIASIPKIWGRIKGGTFTIPVLANGKLYLRFRQSLMCFNIKG